MPNGRCKLHGGMTPTGMALPQTKHGRYSKHLPTRYLTRYDEARNDPEFYALREEIALIDSRLADLLAKIDQGEALATWKALAKTMAEHDSAEDGVGQSYALAKIRELIQRGLGDFATWEDIYRVVEQRRRLAETETRRLEKAQQTITAEQAMLLLAAVVDVIRTHVSDRNILSAVSRDLGRLAPPGARTPA